MTTIPLQANAQAAQVVPIKQSDKPKVLKTFAYVVIPQRKVDGHLKEFAGSLEVVSEGTHGLTCRTGEGDSPATEWFANKHIRRTYTKLV